MAAATASDGAGNDSAATAQRNKQLRAARDRSRAAGQAYEQQQQQSTSRLRLEEVLDTIERDVLPGKEFAEAREGTFARLRKE